MSKKGNLFVITAPSGAGKDTILKKMLSIDDNLSLSVSATTRKPRENEVDGVHYHFLTVEQFEEKIAKGSFFEYAKYADNYYGTPVEYVVEKLEKGLDVIVEIETQGAEKVSKMFPEATRIFINAPSFEELERRLISRGTDDLDVIKKRLEIAKKEVLEQDKFDFIVINDVVDKACEEILNIIRNKR
ncbi:MAG: guanylate kinase [Clostridia bacterium]